MGGKPKYAVAKFRYRALGSEHISQFSKPRPPELIFRVMTKSPAHKTNPKNGLHRFSGLSKAAVISIQEPKSVRTPKYIASLGIISPVVKAIRKPAKKTVSPRLILFLPREKQNPDSKIKV